MNTPEKELSESLLAACKAAGIESPKYIAQDKNGIIWHYGLKPYMSKLYQTWQWAENDDGAVNINHPRYAADWKYSLLEWVEPIEEVDASDISYNKMNSEYAGRRDEYQIYKRAWSDALTWWDASEQPSGIEALVCDDIAKRQQVGITKYGTTVADNPLTHQQWLQHAYEEALDLAIYLKRAMSDKGCSND